MDFVFHIQECLICEFHFHILKAKLFFYIIFWGVGWGGGGVGVYPELP